MAFDRPDALRQGENVMNDQNVEVSMAFDRPDALRLCHSQMPLGKYVTDTVCSRADFFATTHRSGTLIRVFLVAISDFWKKLYNFCSRDDVFATILGTLRGDRVANGPG